MSRLHAFSKVTHGFVVQKFSKHGDCLSQEFVGGQVEFEDAQGAAVDPDELEPEFAFSLEMVQPGRKDP